MRTQLARFLLHVASRLAKESTLCSVKGKWKFQREWEAVPYRPEPHKFAKTDSGIGY
jgi:hypothetical protein